MKRTIICALVFCCAAVALIWFLRPRDRMFRGQPESVWVKGIAYGMSLSDDENKAQVQRWRDLGPEGLEILARGLDAPGRRYRRFHRSVSAKAPVIVRILPKPKPKPDDTRSTRMCILSLISRMGTNALAIAPAVGNALNDEAPDVRQIAINFFTHQDGDKVVLNRLTARHKRQLLPAFLRALEEKTWNWGLRNNAALALGYYPEDAAVVAPVLVNALKDPEPHVRLHAARALKEIAPAVAKSTRAVAVVTNILTDPDDQIAYQAADALRSFADEPDSSVPALINALRSTNTLVACSAVWTLEWKYQGSSAQVIPALTEAAERKDNVGGYARSALKHFETEQRRQRRP